MSILQPIKSKNVMLLSASLLVLSACLPDGDSVRGDKRAAIDAQANYYAQAFQQYNNRSLAMLLNSNAWANTATTLNDGPLDATDDPAFASLADGSAAGFVQSAYCRDGADEYHISWFSQQDAAGNVSFKGLGSGNGGVVSSKINTQFSGDGLSIYDDNAPNTLNFINGGQVNGQASVRLTAGCSALDIPNGSAVIAHAIQQPAVNNQSTTEIVTRTTSCHGSNIGSITENITVNINDPQNNPDSLTVNGRTMTRNDLMNSAVSFHDMGGSIVSSTCFDVQYIATKQLDTDAQQGIDYRSFALAGDTVSNALETHLYSSANNINGKPCNSVKEPSVDDDGNIQYDQNGHIIYTSSFDTCGPQTNSIMTRDVRDVVTNKLEPDVETLRHSCGIRPPQAGIQINGKNASLVDIGAYSGQAELTKTTHNYESVEMVNGHAKPGSRKTYSNVSLHGKTLSCSAKDIAKVSCADMYDLSSIPGTKTVTTPNTAFFNAIGTAGNVHTVSLISSRVDASGSPPQWTRNVSVNGWANPTIPLPKDEQYSNWSYQPNSMSCAYTQTRKRETGCGSDYSGGTKTITEKRTATSTSPHALLNWPNNWTTISQDTSKCTGYCPSPKYWKRSENENGTLSALAICVYPTNGGGSGGGGNKTYWDTDGDGFTDSDRCTGSCGGYSGGDWGSSDDGPGGKSHSGASKP